MPTPPIGFPSPPALAGALLLAAGAALLPAAARADDAAAPAAPPPQTSGGPFGFLNGIGRSSNMLGDMWGVRPLLDQYGMTFNLQEISEVLGNVTGGTRTGFDYDGLTTATLQLDTQRAFGWHGGTFNVSALQIHGRDLSTDDLQTLQTASGIEADRATRLWELWYQQKFLDEDRLDIKIGQQSLDQEFMVSQGSALFVNTMMGWPMLPSADMPGGGPAYPLSALGLRLRARPTDSWTVLAGVFNGTPLAKDGTNTSGTSFPVNGGALFIAELQYAYPSNGTLVTADQGEPLARTYRLGFWYDTERFDDLRFDTNGLSLANPASNGVPLSHAGDYAIYAVADQMIWRQFDEPDRNVNLFARVMGTPLADRNLISMSVNAGVTMHEPFRGRDDDSVGLGVGYAKVSGHATALDQDTAAFTDSYVPPRGSETFVELTYQYQVTPWMQLQPDAQYVFMPGGGVADPNNPGRRVQNEAVLGLRTTITF
jgi:porin